MLKYGRRVTVEVGIVWEEERGERESEGARGIGKNWKQGEHWGVKRCWQNGERIGGK
jgi:hypothetical protein